MCGYLTATSGRSKMALWNITPHFSERIILFHARSFQLAQSILVKTMAMTTISLCALLMFVVFRSADANAEVFNTVSTSKPCNTEIGSQCKNEGCQMSYYMFGEWRTDFASAPHGGECSNACLAHVKECEERCVSLTKPTSSAISSNGDGPCVCKLNGVSQGTLGTCIGFCNRMLGSCIPGCVNGNSCPYEAKSVYRHTVYADGRCSEACPM